MLFPDRRPRHYDRAGERPCAIRSGSPESIVQDPREPADVSDGKASNHPISYGHVPTTATGTSRASLAAIPGSGPQRDDRAESVVTGGLAMRLRRPPERVALPGSLRRRAEAGRARPHHHDVARSLRWRRRSRPRRADPGWKWPRRTRQPPDTRQFRGRPAGRQESRTTSRTVRMSSPPVGVSRLRPSFGGSAWGAVTRTSSLTRIPASRASRISSTAGGLPRLRLATGELARAVRQSCHGGWVGWRGYGRSVEARASPASEPGPRRCSTSRPATGESAQPGAH